MEKKEGKNRRRDSKYKLISHRVSSLEEKFHVQNNRKLSFSTKEKEHGKKYDFAGTQRR